MAAAILGLGLLFFVGAVLGLGSSSRATQAALPTIAVGTQVEPTPDPNADVSTVVPRAVVAVPQGSLAQAPPSASLGQAAGTPVTSHTLNPVTGQSPRSTGASGAAQPQSVIQPIQGPTQNSDLGRSSSSQIGGQNTTSQNPIGSFSPPSSQFPAPQPTASPGPGLLGGLLQMPPTSPAPTSTATPGPGLLGTILDRLKPSPAASPSPATSPSPSPTPSPSPS